MKILASVAAATLGLGLLSSSARAGSIYGGATYDSSTGTGFQSPQTGAAGDGMAVGSAIQYFSGSSFGSRAIRWNASGTSATVLGDLGTTILAFTDNYAYAINTAGTAVGYGEKYNAHGYDGESKGERAIRWDSSGTAATELGNIGTDANGVTYNHAYAVNAAGTTVGRGEKYISGTSQGYRAIRWDSSGTAATELGNIGTNASGGTFIEALAVNDAGTAVGYGSKYDSGSGKGQRAIRWDGAGTAATELGNLGTDANGVTDILARAVNTTGTAVGHGIKYVSGISKGSRAIRWDGSGTAATELGNLGTDANGVTDSHALAINTAGTAVGSAAEFDLAGTPLGSRAVAWGLDGVAIDLNTLLDPGTGWVNLHGAVGISDTGWITGVGSFDLDGAGGQDAYERGFLMQIPEPSSFALLSLGGLGLLRRRRGA